MCRKENRWAEERTGDYRREYMSRGANISKRENRIDW